MPADKHRMRKISLLLALLALAGCDQLGIESPASTKARVEADMLPAPGTPATPAPPPGNPLNLPLGGG